MKVLVTGHRGYIGAHLVPLLKMKGFEVTGCDLNLFPEACWDKLDAPNYEITEDFRSLDVDSLRSFDCVMHLAAISNDPMGDLDPELTYQINRDGSIDLARKAKQAGIGRFLFSSSCSIYGRGDNLDLDELAPLNPVSAYAVSKIETEKAVSELADDDFCPVFLRNATAYGYSPVLRIDLVVNNLLGCALTTGDISIMSDGTPWRPLIHCKDIARAFVAIMDAPREAIFNQAINIGSNSENFQVKDVAELVQKLVPGSVVKYTGENTNDPRNYRVKFDKLYGLMPGFELEYNLESGMRELCNQYKQHHFSEADFKGEKYVRLRILKNKLYQLS